jgi:hypothetical protein
MTLVETLRFISVGALDLRFGGGGFIEVQDDFDPLAPETGYETVYEVNFPKSLAADWSNAIQKKFFLRLRDGNVFARMHLGVNASNKNAKRNSYMNIWLNPSGSRNLEPDPNLLFPNLDAYNRYMAKQGKAPVQLNATQ